MRRQLRSAILYFQRATGVVIRVTTAANRTGRSSGRRPMPDRKGKATARRNGLIALSGAPRGAGLRGSVGRPRRATRANVMRGVRRETVLTGDAVNRIVRADVSAYRLPITRSFRFIAATTSFVMPVSRGYTRPSSRWACAATSPASRSRLDRRSALDQGSRRLRGGSCRPDNEVTAHVGDRPSRPRLARSWVPRPGKERRRRHRPRESHRNREFVLDRADPASDVQQRHPFPPLCLERLDQSPGRGNGPLSRYLRRSEDARFSS